MKKYTMNDFITGKLAVRVNKDNIMDFLKMCEEKGIVWESGDKATKSVHYGAKVIACGFGYANRLTFSADANSTCYSDAGYTFVDFSQIIKPVHYQIIIESDGDTTTAKMIVNGKEVKQAAAKRNPADKANWRMGAQTAFDRLWQKKPKPEKPAEKDGFKVGDRVVINDPRGHDAFEAHGQHGIIVSLKSESLGEDWLCVELDESVYFHDCDGKTKPGHGCYVRAEKLVHEQPTKQKVREVKRAAKAGEYIKLVCEAFSFNEVGQILRVDGVTGTCAFVIGRNDPRAYEDYPDEKWHYHESEYVVLEGYQPGRDGK